MSTATLVTKKFLAARYSVHRKTIEEWVSCGILPVIRVNARCLRFDLEECDAAMKRRSRTQQ